VRNVQATGPFHPKSLKKQENRFDRRRALDMIESEPSYVMRWAGVVPFWASRGFPRTLMRGKSAVLQDALLILHEMAATADRSIFDNGY